MVRILGIVCLVIAVAKTSIGDQTISSTHCDRGKIYCECGEPPLKRSYLKCQYELVTKIARGRIVTDKQKHPWQAALYSKLNQFLCGGSIITKRHILTAGHCVKSFDTRGWTVVVGLLNQIFRDGETYPLLGLKIHPAFMSKNFPVNDVAVAITKRPIKFHMNVWPICLIRSEVDLSGYRALVAGWGVTEYQGVRPASLLDGQVRILSEEECQAAKYIGRVYNSDQMICASSEKTDACQGDSGGPLIVYGSSGNAIQVGIVSFGFGCQTKDSAGVYTRLSKYLDWIDEVTGRTESCILPRDYKNELV